MKVLLTGGTGFIGSNIFPLLSEHFEVFSPGRSELELFSHCEVKKYIIKNKIDIVVHCANPNPVKNRIDSRLSMLDASLRLFLSFYEARDCFDKMIYIGSGAEYDKRYDISNVSEQERGHSIPIDEYGFAKYIIGQMIQESSNIYHICLFGCYGKNDHKTKFITHCINCCKEKKSVTIKQDCLFDYIHVLDLGRMILWICEHDMKHHIYNASGGSHMLLSEIANEVVQQMKMTVPIKILSPGYNKEYTADSHRFWNETGVYPRISMQEGIAMQIQYETI